MYHIAKNISPLNTAINNYFIAFKDILLTLSTTQWKSEDLRGKSYSQFQALQYYNLMYLLVIVYNEIVRTKDLNFPWSYYVNKFKLDTYRKCLACEGVDFDKALEAFGFSTYINESGIEDMEVETNFQVQTNDLQKDILTVKQILLTPYKCINYIN